MIDFLIDHADGDDVGLAGAWALDGVVPTYPAFGTRLTNRVTYLGPVEDKALLRTYTNPTPFTEAVEEADPDLLLLGLNDDLPYAQKPTPATSAELESWARDAGYRPVAKSERFLLLERVHNPSPPFWGYPARRASNTRRSLSATGSYPAARAQPSSGTRGASGRPRPITSRS